jgi:hypothetical protein
LRDTAGCNGGRNERRRSTGGLSIPCCIGATKTVVLALQIHIVVERRAMGLAY